MEFSITYKMHVNEDGQCTFRSLDMDSDDQYNRTNMKSAMGAAMEDDFETDMIEQCKREMTVAAFKLTKWFHKFTVDAKDKVLTDVEKAEAEKRKANVCIATVGPGVKKNKLPETKWECGITCRTYGGCTNCDVHFEP